MGSSLWRSPSFYHNAVIGKMCEVSFMCRKHFRTTNLQFVAAGDIAINASLTDVQEGCWCHTIRQIFMNRLCHIIT